MAFREWLLLCRFCCVTFETSKRFTIATHQAPEAGRHFVAQAVRPGKRKQIPIPHCRGPREAERRLTPLGAALPRPPDRPDPPALSSTAEEPVATIGLKPGNACAS